MNMKTGRPPKPESAKRDKRVTVNLNEEEYELLLKQMQQEQKSISEVLRWYWQNAPKARN